LGTELGVADLEALGIAIEGAALVAHGRVDEGMRRLDQAAAVAAGEDFELPISPAWALCIMIAVCERVGDFGRVAQWCEAMRSIGERLNGRHLIDVCRSAYGHVLASRGEWPAAETELLAALADLEAMRPGMAPDGLARLGELRARQGRSDEARALFERARPHRAALVGLGTLALEAGDARGGCEHGGTDPAPDRTGRADRTDPPLWSCWRERRRSWTRPRRPLRRGPSSRASQSGSAPPTFVAESAWWRVS
jgi:hypothetical protein